jgi:SpoVK/Ycf46/Vps4 family AAA+-type ATPase
MRDRRATVVQRYSPRREDMRPPRRDRRAELAGEDGGAGGAGPASAPPALPSRGGDGDGDEPQQHRHHHHGGHYHHHHHGRRHRGGDEEDEDDEEGDLVRDVDPAAYWRPLAPAAFAAAAAAAGGGGGGHGPHALGFPGATPMRAAAAANGHGSPSRPRQPWEAPDPSAAPSHHPHSALAPVGGAKAAAAAGPAGPSAPNAAAPNAEITPVVVDPSVTFDQVGGLDGYVRALKEMVFLPLTYPELFERFSLSPPRGVLLHGPPGTGKTLLVRALAAHSARASGTRVAFFMRKGADLLSKWVGEAERQLRLLFEEAARQQPSIIFFDEIDGLAPVRSSRQDQIHNSIVSTLLALMDGLDARGRVVVVGATNRPDALDGALRRPGRFDRELAFPLPNRAARAQILRIHTRAWRRGREQQQQEEQQDAAAAGAIVPAPDAATTAPATTQPPPLVPARLIDELAALTPGYCGADLKALCTEAALHAVRRRYPQVYSADAKLAGVDPRRVAVGRADFLAALAAIVPASHRSAGSVARPLSEGGGAGRALLSGALEMCLARVREAFPPAAAVLKANEEQRRREALGGGGGGGGGAGQHQQALMLAAGGAAQRAAALGPGKASASSAASSASFLALSLQRPRLLLCGPPGSGQEQLAAAVLHALEGLPVHAVGLTALLSDPSAHSPEEALVRAFAEARRAAPAVLFLPHTHLWWETAPGPLRAALWMLLEDLPAELPLLLLATADAPAAELDADVARFFDVVVVEGGEAAADGAADAAADDDATRPAVFSRSSACLELATPGAAARRACFEPAVRSALTGQPPQLAGGEGRLLQGGEEEGEREEEGDDDEAQQQQAAAAASTLLQEEDPEARARAADAARRAELAAARRAYDEDQAALRALRGALRSAAVALLADRRFAAFAVPPPPELQSAYYRAVRDPLDVATVLSRVDARVYQTPEAFLSDLGRVVKAAQRWFGPSSGAGGGGGAAAVGGAAAAAPAPLGPSPSGLDPATAARALTAAHALLDEAEGLLAARVPAELAARCAEIERRGGPRPAPDDLQLLLPPHDAAPVVAAGAGGVDGAGASAAAAAAARAASPDVGDQPEAAAGGGGGAGGNKQQQQSGPQKRAAQRYADPEALMRQAKALKRAQAGRPSVDAAAEAAAAGEEPSKSQQQQPSGAGAAAADAEMPDGGGLPEVGGGDTAAADDTDGGGAGGGTPPSGAAVVPTSPAGGRLTGGKGTPHPHHRRKSAGGVGGGGETPSAAAAAAAPSRAESERASQLLDKAVERTRGLQVRELAALRARMWRALAAAHALAEEEEGDEEEAAAAGEQRQQRRRALALDALEDVVGKLLIKGGGGGGGVTA